MLKLNVPPFIVAPYRKEWNGFVLIVFCVSFDMERFIFGVGM